MKNPTLVLASVLASLSLWLVPSVAAAMPAVGSNELRIDRTYVLTGYSLLGFNHHSMSAKPLYVPP
jgi:hypothetical protein